MKGVATEKPSLMHHYQQQQQHQQQGEKEFQFYQQYPDYNNNNAGSNGLPYAAPMPPQYSSMYYPVGSGPFFNGAENAYNQNQRQQPAQTPVMTVGVSTSPVPMKNRCASPNVFGGASCENSGSRGPSPFVSHNGARSSASPLPPPAFHSFQQTQQHSSVTMINPPDPVFRDNSQPALAPHYQQVPPSGFTPPPPPRSGFTAKLLNMLLPYDSFDSDASQGPVPIHQQRFGHPEDDLPLLEELGIVPHRIRFRALAVLNPLKEVAPGAVEDMDLAGPIVFAVMLAFFLSLRGKMQFSTIYGHSVLGIVFTKVLLTLMTDRSVPVQFVISALGYCLIPSVVLAACQSLLYFFLGHVGKTMLLPALLMVLWSAWCATSMLVNGLLMEKQRYLIMYPVVLFYAVFAALTIF